MSHRWAVVGLPALFVLGFAAQPRGEKLYLAPLNVTPTPIRKDAAVKYDYDIVYVRAPRYGHDPQAKKRDEWAEIRAPLLMNPSADLMLLHPDGSEELLVRGGDDGAIADPFVSFDGQSVYYAHVQGIKGIGPNETAGGAFADIYRIHVKSRQITKLTSQVFTPNTGLARWGSDPARREDGKNYLGYGVFNMGPCPLPGGKVVFVSNRNAFLPPRNRHHPCLQLCVMDEDGGNVETIGHLNIGSALHPVVLKDGRIMFSSLESQGLRQASLWGLWSIHPDGTNWGPLLSAFNIGSAAFVTHFQTQLSDGNLVVEEYYQQNNWGFGTYYKFPAVAPPGQPAFGPGYMNDPRNPSLRQGRYLGNGQAVVRKLPFSPHGITTLTPFASSEDRPAGPSVRDDPKSPRVGKFTHPSGAPDNHLLTVYSPGPVNHNGRHDPPVDGGLYLLKDGTPIDEPGQLLLIKNDPRYNEQWPRALVSYKRIYGVDEPTKLMPLANDGKLSPHLPEGTPFGLVGTSSLYKRETYPNGAVPPGSVTATFAGRDPHGDRGLGLGEDVFSLNWGHQGADAGRYDNSDIHAVRILVMEPTTHRKYGPKAGVLFHSHAQERLRILGEIPVRKFDGTRQPLDPDGNPDTSFLAKIPADVAWTFQTLDKDGMVLNMAQTWHQLRPGEIRNDCGGCHSHSQKPTLFKDTAAARADYEVFDLTKRTPLLTSKVHDESGRQWDAKDETGLRFDKGVKNVEFHRDVKPILDRSCAGCHTRDAAKAPKDQWLILDEDNVQGVPGAYYRLVMDNAGEPRWVNKRRLYLPSRYIVPFQSRRSLLVWKLLGRRTDGFSNDDFPSPARPGDPNSLHLKGQPVEAHFRNREIADLDCTGSAMPPKKPLSLEERLTIIRWIDLGCPLDRDFDPAHPEQRGWGWMGDDQRPTLTVTEPRNGDNPALTRILVGLHDAYTGLEADSFEVTADFAIDGMPAGTNLAGRFRTRAEGVRELKFATPIRDLKRGTLSVSVKDREGNVTRVQRTVSVR